MMMTMFWRNFRIAAVVACFAGAASMPGKFFPIWLTKGNLAASAQSVRFRTEYLSTNQEGLSSVTWRRAL